MTKRSEPGDVLDVAGMQQLVDHVKNEQRLHPVVGKPFPSFGERDVAEPARMPKEGAVLGVRHGRRVLGPVRFGKLFRWRQWRPFKPKPGGNTPGFRATRNISVEGAIHLRSQPKAG